MRFEYTHKLGVIHWYDSLGRHIGRMFANTDEAFPAMLAQLQHAFPKATFRDISSQIR